MCDIWKTKIPLKIQISLWMSWVACPGGRVQTTEQLRRRSWDGSILCKLSVVEPPPGHPGRPAGLLHKMLTNFSIVLNRNSVFFLDNYSCITRIAWAIKSSWLRHCKLCEKTETRDYIFFRCPIAVLMWSWIRDSLGWNKSPSSLDSLVEQHLNTAGLHQSCVS